MMRIIISAIALVLVLGVVLPTSTDARPPRKVQKWGCTFEAVGLSYAAFPDTPVVWFGKGRIKGCNPKYKAVFIEKIYEAIPGSRDRLVARNRYVWRMSPLVAVPTGVAAGRCLHKGSRPEHPFYYMLKIKRIGKPGVVRVASRNRLNPCPQGMWPSLYADRR